MTSEPAELKFTDDDAARAHLESIHWPDGPICPHCGEAENVTRLHGEAHRPGVVQCNSCREQFTVTVGTAVGLAFLVPSVGMLLLLVFAPFIPGWFILAATVAGTAAIGAYGSK